MSSTRVYSGRSVATRTERVVYSCPCGERFAAEVYRAVDARDAEPTRRFRAGTLNRVRCERCGSESEVQLPVTFHDGARGQLLLLLPDGARHRELAERAALFAQLAEDGVPPPDYVLSPEVRFAARALATTAVPAAALAVAPTEASEAPEAVERLETVEPVEKERTDRHVATPALLLEPNAAAARERAPLSLLPSLRDEDLTPLPRPAQWRAAHDSDMHTRVHMSVPDPRAAVTERWIAGRESAAAFLVEDRVLVCASLPPAALEAFVPGHVELRAQLHRLPSYPLLSLTLLALDPPGSPARPRPEESRLLTVPLDVARAAHRVVLETLGRRCSFALDLYDSQYLPVITHEVTAPLEENVRRLVAEAKDALERLAPATRSFERARGQFLSTGYDRLGRTVIDLPDDGEPLDRPGLVRSALSRVARWSEPNAEAYLLEIRSLPLGKWRQLRARVVRRALDVGIAMSRSLVERSAKEHGAPLPSWPELLELQVKRFTEVAARLKPNDLSATEEADNWESLMRECAQAGVAIDEQVRKLAAQSLKRARVGQGGGVDLRTLATAELVALLEQKDLRREAAVILCERRETPTLAALFGAIRRMTRHEANRVLPAVPAFGHAAEKWLIDGLKAKKSYLRQGCALALGTIGTPAGTEALAQLLIVEPTEIWTEVARALGDVGTAAVAPLTAAVREAGVEERERVVEALAHIGGRGGAPGRSLLDGLAAGRDGLVAAAAQRALALLAEVRAADREVRSGSGGTDTVVRAFTRRFYEVLGGDSSLPVELQPEDVTELDDEPDDEATPVGPPRVKARQKDGESTNPTPKTSLPRGRG